MVRTFATQRDADDERVTSGELTLASRKQGGTLPLVCRERLGHGDRSHETTATPGRRSDGQAVLIVCGFESA